MAVRDSTLRTQRQEIPVLSRAGGAVWNALALILRTNTGRIGFIIVASHVTLALIGPWITPYPPTDYHLADRFSGPSSAYWLGTDEFGRDVSSRVLAGARSIMWISVIGTIFGVTLGTIVGVTSGYLGGKIDQFIMRIVDWFLAIPSLLLTILVINMVSQRFSGIDHSWIIIFVIGISFMPNNSRVIRSATLAVKPLEFVQSARLRGEPTLYIMFREVLPNVFPVVAVEATIRLSFALLLTAGLGFLGLGVKPPEPDWGLMVSENADHLGTVPWAALAPGIAMASLVVGINLLADGIRQAQNLPETGE
ncbi:MAG: ABC transporter permease [Dehalococcoidia bacterium]|nr:ABC transporter permease [Dehalococcoidia bacterium]